MFGFSDSLSSVLKCAVEIHRFYIHKNRITVEEPHCGPDQIKNSLQCLSNENIILTFTGKLTGLAFYAINCRLCLLELLMLTSVVCTSSEVVLCTLNAFLNMHFILI